MESVRPGGLGILSAQYHTSRCSRELIADRSQPRLADLSGRGVVGLPEGLKWADNLLLVHPNGRVDGIELHFRFI